MRHHAQNIAPFVDDAGDVAYRAIRIRLIGYVAFAVTISENNLIVAFQCLQRLVVGEVASFPVGDGNTQNLALLASICEKGSGIFHTQMNKLSNEFKRTISQ